MTTFKSFPDLGRSFAKMRLQDKLDEISDDTVLGFCIRHARINKMPLQEIGITLLEQYKDAPDTVLSVIPEDTMKLINDLYGKQAL